MKPPQNALSISISLRNQRVLIVGAGAVARRKLSQLAASEATVVIIAPGPDDFDHWLQRLRVQAPSLALCWSQRRFEPADLTDASLVFACTDDSATNAEIAGLAKDQRIWCAVADDPLLGDFTLTSSMNVGPLLFGISSNRAAPALARLARERLQLSFGPEWRQLVKLAAEAKSQLKASADPLSTRSQKLRALGRSQLLTLLRTGQRTNARRTLQSIVGIPPSDAVLPRQRGDVIVVSAFGPFPGVPVNPTAEVVRGLLKRFGPESSLKLQPVTLPTCFDQAWETLRDVIAPLQEEGCLRGILSLGVAASSQQIALERIAINARISTRSDASGRALPPMGEPILPGGPHGLMSRLAVDALAHELKAKGLPVKVSNSAGTYVCNEVMFRLLAWCNLKGFEGFAGFVHIPMVPETLSQETVSDALHQLLLSQMGFAESSTHHT